MEQFRKLNIRLPRQPVVDQRPWAIAGWVLAGALLLFIIYCYLEHKKHPAVSKQTKEWKA